MAASWVEPTPECPGDGAGEWRFMAEGVSKRRLTHLVQKFGFREGPTTAWWRVGKGKVTPQNLQLLCFDTPSAEAGPTQTSIDRWSQQIFERQRPLRVIRCLPSATGM
jgi:hypothetical protein